MITANEAIFLYFLTLKPIISMRDFIKIRSRFRGEAYHLASTIQGDRSTFKRAIPECTDMDRYLNAIHVIDSILGVVPMYSGGSHAVIGYMRYIGILTKAGVFRRGT